MAAYRSASRLFEGMHVVCMHACLRVRLNEPLFAGCHLPLTYIGMEYIRTNNLTLAEQVFSHNAQRPIVPTSPRDMWEAYAELLCGSFWNKLAQCAAHDAPAASE